MGKARFVDDKKLSRKNKGKRRKPMLASTKWKMLSLLLYTIVVAETTYILSFHVNMEKYLKLAESYLWQIKDLF